MKIIYNSKEIKLETVSQRIFILKYSACNSAFSFHKNEKQLISHYNEVGIILNVLFVVM
jgi:hypothetical protein